MALVVQGLSKRVSLDMEVGIYRHLCSSTRFDTQSSQRVAWLLKLSRRQPGRCGTPVTDAKIYCGRLMNPGEHRCVFNTVCWPVLLLLVLLLLLLLLLKLSSLEQLLLTSTTNATATATTAVAKSSLSSSSSPSSS